MDIGRLYGNYTPSAAGQTAAKRSLCDNSFRAGLEQRMEDRQGANAVSGRIRLTDDEISYLADKYDPRNMDQDALDAFLDDLADMGVISDKEKHAFGYNGVYTLPSLGGFGRTTSDFELTPLMGLRQAGGDLVKWMSERVAWQAGGTTFSDPAKTAVSKTAADRYNEMNGAVNEIVARMAAARGDDGGTEDGEETDIVSQILDPNSAFYEGMYARMKLRLEESEEEKTKQAIIDALDGILESLSAKDDDKPEKRDTVRPMAELSQVTDSLDRFDPRKEQLNLLRERLQQLGIYMDLDAGIKDKDETGETLTQSLIHEESREQSPSIFDII